MPFSTSFSLSQTLDDLDLGGGGGKCVKIRSDPFSIATNWGYSSGLSWEREEEKKQTNKQKCVLMNRTRLSWKLKETKMYGLDQVIVGLDRVIVKGAFNQ